jgi:hypothetical protein
MAGPFGFIYSINYFITNFSQALSMLNANSFVVIELFYTILRVVKDVELAVRRSSFRRWLQRKSKKSVILRYIFVLASMAITSQLMRLARFIVESKLGITSKGRSINLATSSPAVNIADSKLTSLDMSASRIPDST